MSYRRAVFLHSVGSSMLRQKNNACLPGNIICGRRIMHVFNACIPVNIIYELLTTLSSTVVLAKERLDEVVP